MARGTCALQKSRILPGGGVLPSYGRVAGVKGVDKPYYTGPLVWDLTCTPASSSLRPYKVKYLWYLNKKELVLRPSLSKKLFPVCRVTPKKASREVRIFFFFFCFSFFID